MSMFFSRKLLHFQDSFDIIVFEVECGLVYKPKKKNQQMQEY